MFPDIQAQKSALRKDLLAKRRALGAQERKHLSCKTVENVIRWDRYQRSETVMLYHPISGEVDLLPLIEQSEKKRFCLPRVTGQEHMEAVLFVPDTPLVKNAMGIFEPVGQALPHEEIDLIFAPGLAFCRDGRRLGFGGGYYDRYLTSFDGLCAGVAYAFQVLPCLPLEETDRRVDYLLTPQGIYFCNGGNMDEVVL